MNIKEGDTVNISIKAEGDTVYFGKVLLVTIKVIVCEVMRFYSVGTKLEKFNPVTGINVNGPDYGRII